MRKLEMDELQRLSVEEFKQAEKHRFLIVLENIRSLNNVGSFFRTADAFRAKKLVLGGYTPTPPHRDITKSAIGAEQAVDWEKAEDVHEYLRNLKSQGYKIISVEQVEGSTSLQHFLPDSSSEYVFVFGNEVDGVSDESIRLSEEVVEIPQFGTKHSFNVSVSAGIVLWEFVRSSLLSDN